MALQYGINLRNAGLAAKNTNLGATSTLKIFSGAVPAGGCSAADPSGLLCTMTLPASPFAAPSAGAMALAGTWSGTASGTGNAACHRIYDSSGNCAMQGNVTSDLVLNNVSISSGQSITVTQYTLTSGNA